jgi:hypothetical protein
MATRSRSTFPLPPAQEQRGNPPSGAVLTPCGRLGGGAHRPGAASRGHPFCASYPGSTPRPGSPARAGPGRSTRPRDHHLLMSVTITSYVAMNAMISGCGSRTLPRRKSWPNAGSRHSGEAGSSRPRAALISACSTEVRPGLPPASMSACTTQRRTVSRPLAISDRGGAALNLRPLGYEPPNRYCGGQRQTWVDAADRGGGGLRLARSHEHPVQGGVADAHRRARPTCGNSHIDVTVSNCDHAGRF